MAGGKERGKLPHFGILAVGANVGPFLFVIIASPNWIQNKNTGHFRSKCGRDGFGCFNLIGAFSFFTLCVAYSPRIEKKRDAGASFSVIYM